MVGRGSGRERGAFGPRVVAAGALGGAACVLAALILGEYEFRGVLPYGAGLLLGLVVGELVAEVGRYRSPIIGGLCAVMVAAALLWAGWIDAGEGLRPLPLAVWPAMAIGAVTAALRAGDLPRRRRRRTSTPERSYRAGPDEP
ncbi:MAG: hypothetical protein ACRD29_16230 [Acidimicrobiales bacterium]